MGSLLPRCPSCLSPGRKQDVFRKVASYLSCLKLRPVPREIYWAMLPPYFRLRQQKCTLSLFLKLGFILLYLFWPHHMACGILVPLPRIKLIPPALEAQSLNHWTTNKVQMCTFSECILVSCKATPVDSDGPPSLDQSLELLEAGSLARPNQGQPQTSSTNTQVEAPSTREGACIPGKAVVLTAALPSSFLGSRTLRAPRMQTEEVGILERNPVSLALPGAPRCTVLGHLRTCPLSNMLSLCVPSFSHSSQAFQFAWLLSVGKKVAKDNLFSILSQA